MKNTLIEIYTKDGRRLINPRQIKLVEPDGADYTIIYFKNEVEHKFRIKFRDLAQQIFGTTEVEKRPKQRPEDQETGTFLIQCIRNIMYSLKPTIMSDVDYGAIMNYLETLEVIYEKDTK